MAQRFAVPSRGGEPTDQHQMRGLVVGVDPQQPQTVAQCLVGVASAGVPLDQAPRHRQMNRAALFAQRRLLGELLALQGFALEHLTGVTGSASASAHALWYNDDWYGFQRKWKELSGQGLRLVDVEVFGGLVS